MVAIDNKTSSTAELVGIKSKKSADEVDMLFAELFSLVNMNNDEELNTNKVELDFNNNFIEDSNTRNIEVSKLSSNKTENVAKSLAEIFYKELGINLPDKFSSSNEKKSDNHNLQLVDKKINENVLKTTLIQNQKNETKSTATLHKINNKEVTGKEEPKTENINISVSISERKLNNTNKKN